MIVFYSWQSWISPNTNRNFIYRAIEIAIEKAVSEEKFLKLDPLLQRDTEGLTGSPDIADSIFEKIRECDVFIGDVTPIAIDQHGNKIPNPNVLTELGYAASELGWDRVICVLNTEYGHIEELPFDIRQQRLTTYKLAEDMPDTVRRDERKKLSGSIASSLKGIHNRHLPDVEYLNNQIHHYVYAIRVAAPIILWAFDKTEENSAEEKFVHILLDQLINDADEASGKKLPSLLVEKSHAFTPRQKKRCRELTKATSHLATRVKFNLMLWDMQKRHSEEHNTETKYNFREYLAACIDRLRSCYENEWFELFDNLDHKYYLGPDEYLFGREPHTPEQIQEMKDKIYELNGRSEPREDYDKSWEKIDFNDQEMDEMSARISIHLAYKDEEREKLVWDFIQILKNPEY